jgi:hypothetical protein
MFYECLAPTLLSFNIIVSDLAVSVALACIACCVIGVPFHEVKGCGISISAY